MSKNIIIVFDTETTGFSPVRNEIVQLSYILYDIKELKIIYATKKNEDIVNIIGDIPKETTDVHGISKAMTSGKRPIKDHIDEFIEYCNQAGTLVGHNIKFDIKMITGQMKKIMKEFPQEIERYNKFLQGFEVVGNKLPEAAYCTMIESQGICAQLKGTQKLKYEKLMEVHKLLFNQNVGGQLHNALVDISVTLRVYLKLTLDIDICESMSEFETGITNVTNNNDICSLIKPININGPIKSIDYTGELITGVTNSTKGLEEENVIVQTSKKMVKNVQQQAITNICTSISICKSILDEEGNKTEEICDTSSLQNVCNVEREKPRGGKRKNKSTKKKTKKTKKSKKYKKQNKSHRRKYY